MESVILDKLLMVTSLFQRDMARELAGTPLTESRLTVLWTLTALGPSTQQTLAEAISVTPRNISGLVDALEKHGYVQRTPHLTDRRAVIVELTPSCEQMMAQMRKEHGELDATLLSAVAPEDRPGLERGIDAIIAKLTELISEAEEAAAQSLPAAGTSSPGAVE